MPAPAAAAAHLTARGGRADPDLLLVSLGSTAGLRAADADLKASLERGGARVALAAAEPRRDRRTFALTDLAWARAARRAARRALAAQNPRALLYSTVTAALLWPRPGAVRFDATAAANRPGRHGIWQRPAERRRLRAAPLLVPATEAALTESGLADEPAVVVPIPVEPSGPPAARDIAALTYAADPVKKGLERVLGAWELARRPGEELVVAGLAPARVAELVGADPATAGIRAVGSLPRDQYRALLRRARVFVTAPRREDYGAAQLEALADGCVLVSTPAPGPYPALELAWELDPQLVSEQLGPALRVALDEPRPAYPKRAAELLSPYRRAAVDAVVAERLLPALLG